LAILFCGALKRKFIQNRAARYIQVAAAANASKKTQAPCGSAKIELLRGMS